MPSCIVRLLGDISECYRMGTYEVLVCVEKEKIQAAAMLPTSKQLVIENRKQFLAEAGILKKLSHPNILQFYGVITALLLTIIVGLCQSKKISFLIIVHHKSEIAFFYKKKKLEKTRKARYSAEAAAVLKYLTEKGYVHKEVKAENCLIDRNMKLKLANFCCAGSDPQFIHKELLESISAGWLAPQTMLKHDFSKETDVWAFGILMEIYEDGDMPYRDLSNLGIRSFVIRSQRHLKLSKEEPSGRPTFQELESTLGGIGKDAH
uniref:Protein kinase domain-containing protein n=1 Tax=Wuchereria bancrofti TaxID=6293 RepID=A0AAF5PK94_WUCBA